MKVVWIRFPDLHHHLLVLHAFWLMFIVYSNKARGEGVLSMEVLPIVRGSQEGVKESQVVEADLRKYTDVHMKYTHHIRIHSHVNVQFDYGGYKHNYTMKYKQYISAYLQKVKWFRDACSLGEGGFVETGQGKNMVANTICIHSGKNPLEANAK